MTSYFCQRLCQRGKLRLQYSFGCIEPDVQSDILEDLLLERLACVS
jgi:hypothetical protein